MPFMSDNAWKGVSGRPSAWKALSYDLIESDGEKRADEGEQVVAVGEAVASRLVDEDAEFSHCSHG